MPFENKVLKYKTLWKSPIMCHFSENISLLDGSKVR